jgi:endonuclease/exonuclease/phosphatase family metal-dependent hydrolase
MYRPRWALLCVLAACSGGDDGGGPADGGVDAAAADAASADATSADAAPADAAPADASPADASDAAAPDAIPPDATPDAWVDAGPGTLVRIAAANITSGNLQRYEAPGIRILQGLRPDIALLQEMNHGDSSSASIRAFVDTAFGPEFHYYREPTGHIPNGIVSRYPIVASGSWDQPDMTDREFAWARIDIPGPLDLWAVSVHLKAGGATARRRDEAEALARVIAAEVPAADYLVIGGDFNTDARTEPCLGELADVVVTTAPWPADPAGDGDTNASRDSPYDWVLFDRDLASHAVAVDIGAGRYRDGLVFDSRRYQPLADVAPVQAGDSGAPSMQHMAVVRDVRLPL